jgi:Cu-Zn family superoxide dismutase
MKALTMLRVGCVLSVATMLVACGSVRNAVCVVRPTAGNSCSGTVHLTQLRRAVKVEADISGLTPNSQHAIHVHAYGDITSDDGKSAGGHYNPRGHDHGLPTQSRRHAGDLGNLTADATGRAHYVIEANNISIAGRKNPIVGRAIIIHAKHDTGAQPTGAAGARIGSGVIGVAKD